MKWLVKLGALIVLGSNLVVNQKAYFPFIFAKVLVFYIGVWVMIVGYIPLLAFKKYRPRKIAPILAHVGAAAVGAIRGKRRSIHSNMMRNRGLVSLIHYATFAIIARSVLEKEFLIKANSLIAGVFATWDLTHKRKQDKLDEKVPMDNPLFSGGYLVVSAAFTMSAAKNDRKWQMVLVPQLMALLHYRKTSPTMGFIAGLIGPIVLLVLPFIYPYLKSKKIDRRVYGWIPGLKGFKDKPIFGWGIDNYYLVFQKYADARFYNTNAKWFDDAHNKYVGLLAEQGIVGLGTYAWLVGDTYINLKDKWLRRGLIAYSFNVLSNVDSHLSSLQFWLLVACSNNTTTPTKQVR